MSQLKEPRDSNFMILLFTSKISNKIYFTFNVCKIVKNHRLNKNLSLLWTQIIHLKIIQKQI